MEQIDWEKLISAIELIVYKSLKENSDDSYSHKLIDLVDHVRPKLNLDHLNKLVNIIGTALSQEKASSDIELSTAFKLIGTIVSDERVIQENPELVITSFTWIIKFSDLLSDLDDPHYDLQFSFLKCISKLCSTQSGCRFLARKDDLLLIIFHLLTKSQGFYVQMEAKTVITSLLSNILAEPDLTSRLSPYLHQMLLMNNKAHMECLLEIVANEKMRHFLLDQFKLLEILLSKLNSVIKQDDNLLIIFCKILALCEFREENIQSVVKSLLEAQKLKAIVAIYSTLFEHHGNAHLEDWRRFIVYQINKNGVLGAKEVTKFNLTSDLLMFILRSISSEIINKLSSQDQALLVVCIGDFLLEPGIHGIPKKVLLEGLQKFDLIWKASNDPGVINQSIYKLMMLIQFEPNSLQDGIPVLELDTPVSKISLLKSLRELMYSHRQIIPSFNLEDVSLLLRDLLKMSSSLEYHELVDSVLEVVISLIRSDPVMFYDQCFDLIHHFFTFWVDFYQRSNDSSLISSCLPILLCVDLYLDEDLMELRSYVKHETIPQLLIKYLDEGEYLLRDSVIRSIDINLPPFIQFGQWNHQVHCKMFTEFYGFPMSQMILGEIDSEVISMILQIWIKIVEAILTKINRVDRLNLIAMLYQSGFFTSVWLLLKDQLITEMIKCQTFEVVRKVGLLFQSMEMNESELVTIFNDLRAPEFFIIVEDATHKSPIVIPDREKVIDDIFKNHMTLPTQDLINVVTEKLHGTKKLTRKKRDIGYISNDLLVSFFSKPNEPMEPHVSDNVHHTFAILDDIIAARSFDTRIPSDCY